MLEEQFYTRLVLNIIVSVMFAYALLKMAQYNNQEIEPKKHLVMKVLGWFFVGLSGILLISCIISFVNVDFPTSVIGPIISPNMIVRPSSANFYWGYPTIIQNSVLSSAMGVFTLLGFGGYFLFFKSSKSKWWKKILKFITVLFLYAFMASSTNFHYFDFWEFVAPTLFLTLWFIIINRTSKEKNNSTPTKDSYVKNQAEQNNYSTTMSIKPYFWIGLILIILGNIWCLCFEHLGIYLTDTDDYYDYKYLNPGNYRAGIYPTNENDPALGFSSTLGNDDRLIPFENKLSVSENYALGRKGQELWIYKLPHEFNSSNEKLNYLRYLFENVNWPLSLVEKWNDMALGEDAVSYYSENNGEFYSATVFIYKNHLGVVLSKGHNLKECVELNEITLSKFSKFDYNRPHISVLEFQIINIMAWIGILSILSIFIIKKVKSLGGFKYCLNKQSKTVTILNICYIIGWFIFSILSVLTNKHYFEQYIWGGFIPFWLIICAILNYTIKLSFEPKSEFYLIPIWLKNLLVKHNLNTQLLYRIILLFIIWPFFYLCLVPVLGFFPCVYTVCASGILGLILCIISVFNWIRLGKGVKVE